MTESLSKNPVIAQWGDTTAETLQPGQPLIIFQQGHFERPSNLLEIFAALLEEENAYGLFLPGHQACYTEKSDGKTIVKPFTAEDANRTLHEKSKVLYRYTDIVPKWSEDHTQRVDYYDLKVQEDYAEAAKKQLAILNALPEVQKRKEDGLILCGHSAGSILIPRMFIEAAKDPDNYPWLFNPKTTLILLNTALATNERFDTTSLEDRLPEIRIINSELDKRVPIKNGVEVAEWFRDCGFKNYFFAKGKYGDEAGNYHNISRQAVLALHLVLGGNLQQCVM